MYKPGKKICLGGGKRIPLNNVCGCSGAMGCPVGTFCLAGMSGYVSPFSARLSFLWVVASRRPWARRGRTSG